MKLPRLAFIGLACAGALALFLSTHQAAVASAALAATNGSCGKNLSCVIAFGNARIDERVAALNVLIGKVNLKKHLTDAQKTALVADANTNINGLKALRTKLDAETTIAAARADVKSIYTDYRIFAVALPLAYHEVWLDELQSAQTAFVTNEPTISTAIENAKNHGCTVTMEQTQFTDIQNKVTDAGTQLTAAAGLIPQIKPSGYPGTDQTLKQMSQDLRQAHTDLTDAGHDLKNIRNEIHACEGTTSGTPTPTATKGS